MSAARDKQPDRKAPRRAPRQQRSQDTVTVLLDATEKVVSKVGVRRATTAMIAERAGVAKGAMFRYFPSKDAVLAAWEERRIQSDGVALSTVLAELLERRPPLEEAVRTLVASACEILVRHASYHPGATLPEIMEQASARLTEKKSILDRIAAMMASALEHSRDRQRIVVRDVGLASRIIVDIVVFLTLSAATRDSVTAAYQREIEDVVVRYLLGGGPPSASSR